MKKSFLTLREICVIGILGALAAVLMLFDFPIFIAPSFYRLDLSDVPGVIGALALGPVPALFIQIVRILVKLLIKPTSSAFVGEITVFLVSSVYCVSAGYIYQKDKSKRNLIKALIISSILMITVATAGNYFFILQAYVSLYKLPLDSIISMGHAIFPIVNSKLSFVLCCVLPFNIIKSVIADLIVYFSYDRISPLINGTNK